MSVGVVIGIIVAVDIILSLIQYYRETKSGGRAEEYLENDNQWINNSVRSTEEQAIHRVSELDPDPLYLEAESQSTQKNNKQSEYSNIQHNHWDESKNNAKKIR